VARAGEDRNARGPSGGIDKRYQLTPINTRPWLLNGLSLRLIESHYENHYGGALRRLNAITEQFESLDFTKTPGHAANSLKRTPEAVRRVADLNKLPVDRITEVRVLDPYFYR
jgi:hypothetical protein